MNVLEQLVKTTSKSLTPCLLAISPPELKPANKLKPPIKKYTTFLENTPKRESLSANRHSLVKCLL